MSGHEIWPEKWNGKAEQDERALRITTIVLSHSLASMALIVTLLGGSAFEFGIYTFLANGAATLLFMLFYLQKLRGYPLTELMLLEVLLVNVGFTVTFGYLLNRGLWLLALRPL